MALSRTLSLWIPPQVDRLGEEGRLLLAWTNLGALVEGTLKWFACVYYDDYQKDQNAIRKKKGALVLPDGAKFDTLRAFFEKSVWTPGDNYDSWILKVQQRRNAIHAFRKRDIGDFDDFHAEVRRYAEFLEDINSRVPNPDE